MTDVNTNTFQGPNQGAAAGYVPDTIIESSKVDADLLQIKNDLDYHVSVLQALYTEINNLEVIATEGMGALDIVSRINASAYKIDADNLESTVAKLQDIADQISTHLTSTSAMHPETSIQATGMSYSSTPATVITSCANLLDEIKNIRYQMKRMNGKTTWIDTPDGSLSSLKSSVNTLISDLSGHTSNTLNPHSVTKTQVGLANVDNVKQATKTEFDTHATSVANPHSVTKTQVGLGNVDDVKQATKTEFDAHATSVLNPHSVTKTQVGLGNVDNIKQATKTEFDTHAGNASAHHTRYTDSEAVGAINSDAEHSSTAAHYYADLIGKPAADAFTITEVDNLKIGRLPAQYMEVVTKSSNYTVDTGDYLILVDTTAGEVTVTLPAAATSTGRVLQIKKINAVANPLIIDAHGSELIDGEETLPVTRQWYSYTVACNGTEWFII